MLDLNAESGKAIVYPMRLGSVRSARSPIEPIEKELAPCPQKTFVTLSC